MQRLTLKKLVRNERGIALITALLLTTLAMVMLFAVLYLVTSGIKTTSGQKHYKSSLEASYGGAELVTRDILPQIFLGYTSTAIATPYKTLINFSFTTSNNCLRDKLNNKSAQWSSCGGNSTTDNAKDTPDMVFTLKGANPIAGGYTVYSKIIDAQPGNSDMSGVEMLEAGTGVTGATPGISPKHVPGLYRVEVLGEREVSPQEKGRLSVLYAY